MTMSNAEKAELAKYKEHSVALNSIAWKAAKALGEIPEGVTEIEVSPEQVVDRLIAKAALALPEGTSVRIVTSES